MITEKKFCKKCGQILKTKVIPFMTNTFIEIDDGIYCIDCGREEVKRRRAKK
jgi:superfamily II helicase